jgi:predicted Zn-dependent protease
MPTNEGRKKNFTVGIMRTRVEERTAPTFEGMVEEAVDALEEILAEDLDMHVTLFEFAGPHLSPQAGAYAPLDFLQMGLTEKLERNVDFLLVVTEVDVSSTTLSYVLALPSQLTNVGIISTKRLSPAFWGNPQSRERTTSRLVALMIHTLGHLLNLRHHSDPQNVMHDFANPEDLDAMTEITREQIERMKTNLPRESHERVADRGKFLFTLKRILIDWPSIWHAIRRANPLRLATMLPTMITTALSVDIVLFFTAEIWDVASTVELYQVGIFSLVSFLVATFVLYRAFTLRSIFDRQRTLSESTVVTQTATFLSLFLTVVIIYLGFFVLVYLGALTIFPRRLMATWPTVDPATRVIDHAKLSLFIATMSVLVGSLGGRAESQVLIRNVLFIDEET